MAFNNTCGVSNSSPYCVCTDYYGNILPEYKFFNTTTQTYSCCNDLVDYVKLIDSTSIEDDKVNLVSFAASSNSSCTKFYDNIKTNGDLKKFPLIYYQSLLNSSLFNTFSSPNISTINENRITCTSGIPYMVSYPNYSNNQLNYKILCGNSNTTEIQNLNFLNSSTTEIPYTINYVIDTDGKNCLTNECELKYNISTLNQYNIGDRVYESKGSINSDSLLLKWWFWFILLFIILICSFGLYFLYYHGMNTYFDKSVNYLNNVSKGLGDTAKNHAKKKLKAHFHINT